MQATAVIAASGLGRRMGAAAKKQYLLLEGIPILARSVNAFLHIPYVEQVVVVVPPGETVQVRKILKPYCHLDQLVFTEGGERRQDSVYNGLQIVNRAAELVCIHDGARPLVSKALIETTMRAALQWGAAIPVLPVTDTLKEVSADGMIKSTFPRENLRRAQTPQVFRQALIQEAYRKAEVLGIHATDDAYLLELLGCQVFTVPGDPENLKITCPTDLQIAEALLKGVL
jgi:2-C-methyl-D-erythritol 4-phosphate cytidylyltransferase